MSDPLGARVFSRGSHCVFLPWAGPLVALLAGCSGSAGRVEAPSVDGAAAGQQALDLYDANHDGSIVGAELDSVPSLKQDLSRLDPSGAGRVTADAIAARVKDWGRIALVQAQTQVTLDGKPLADAEVKFVPEKFLGPNVAAGAGKTDYQGMANIVGPPIAKNGVNYMGMNCGFYRIEVSKQQGGKEIVPERYNAQTTLGVELAPDSEMPIALSLKSKP